MACGCTSENGKGLPTPQARLLLLQLPLVRSSVRWVRIGPLLRRRAAPWPARCSRLCAANDLVLIDRGLLCGRFARSTSARRTSPSARQRSRLQDLSSRWGRSDSQVMDLERSAAEGRGTSSCPTRHHLPDQGLPSQCGGDLGAGSKRDQSRRVRTTRDGDQVEAATSTPDCAHHRRWEIETTRLEIKVTQGMDGAFRSRTTEGIAFEVAGHCCCT